MKITKSIRVSLTLAALCLSSPAVFAQEAVLASDYAPLTDPVNVLDGFEEDEPFWQPILSQDNSKFASVSTANVDKAEATEGTRMCELTSIFPGGSIYARFATTAPIFTDWTGATEFKLDVLNPGTKAVRLAFIVQVGEKWDWNESKQVNIKPGMNKDVTFSLKGIYNNPQNKFSGYKGTPETLMGIKAVMLQVYATVKGENTLYIDNLRVIK